MDNAALAIGPEQRQTGLCQLMPAEDIDRELFFENFAAQILDRSRLAIGAIVEERVELAAGHPGHFHGAGFDRFGIAVFEMKRFEAIVFQALQVLILARRGDHPPAAFLQTLGASQAYARRAAGDENGFLRHG